jgi:hypothetical protein
MSDSPEDDAAVRHMRLGSSFERSFLLHQALVEYGIVAERFKTSKVYPAAVRKLAVLNCNPQVPNASDSTALYWFRTYMTLNPPPHDRENAQVCIALLQRIVALRDQLARRSATTDSLMLLSRRQSAEIANKTRRLQETENALNEARSRLKRMKDVDLQTRRRVESQ